MEVVETRGKETLKPSTRRSIPSIDDDEVVGFDKDAEIIMKKLIGGIKELDVISIYGMPGLGKTTLARKVYNNPSIVNYFDVKAWCSVSQTYNVRSLLIEIFEQATNTKYNINEINEVAGRLRRILTRKRYLIVLDDIWEVAAWEDLGLCFPRGDDGSRVMVTTRIQEVAEHLKHCSDPYPLRFLTLEESWILLQKKVFRGDNCPPDLLQVGLQVARHCKGLPLVIVLIAGIIAKMGREASLWLEVANDLSSIALGEESMKVIQTSYDHLEDHLKTCLLYMGLFPEDHEIREYDLLKLWIAEEFVLNIETENMEESCRVCLNDLLNRSLVMVSKKKINGDIECCILHDLVREFCLRKLTEEKFMKLIVPYSPYQHLCSMNSRLCVYIHDDLVKELDHSEYQLDNNIPTLESKEAKHFGECPRPLEFIAHLTFKTWNRSDLLPLLVKLKFVRGLHNPYLLLPSSWPSAVQSLTHLRYLNICVRDFDFKWISHLLDLQTLVVLSCDIQKTSPATIWKMTKLRHVSVNNFYLVWDDNDRAIFEESSITLLENLKSLSTFSIDEGDRNPRFWWRFVNLEELSLEIHGVPNCPLFPSSEIHTRLESLDLQVRYKGFWDSFEWQSYFVVPSNLRNLSLVGPVLTEEIVLRIARLRNLESLTLRTGFPWWPLESFCWDVTNVKFPALKYLELHVMRMNEWKASEESFPVLEVLSIKTAYYFNEIPPSFADIPTLRLIKLCDYDDSLGVSAMNIKKEIEENTGCDSLQVLLL